DQLREAEERVARRLEPRAGGLEEERVVALHDEGVLGTEAHRASLSRSARRTAPLLPTEHEDELDLAPGDPPGEPEPPARRQQGAPPVRIPDPGVEAVLDRARAAPPDLQRVELRHLEGGAPRGVPEDP